MSQSRKGKNADYQISTFLSEYTTSKKTSTSQARKFLTHRFKNKDIYRVLEVNIRETANRKLILLALSMNREHFLPLFLLYYGSDTNTLNEIHFFNALTEKPLSNTEQQQLVQYIIKNWKYDIRFLSHLDQVNLCAALDGILANIETDGLKPKHLQALAHDPNYLTRIQDQVRDGIDSVPEYRKNWMQYLDLSIPESQELLNKHYTIIDIQSHLRFHSARYIESSQEKVRIALKIIHRIDLSAEERSNLKCYIVDTINSIVDVDSDQSIIPFLKDIAYIDKGFSEAFLIALHRKTKLYSTVVFQALASIGSEYAYKELIAKLLNADRVTTQIRIAKQLLLNYPRKATVIQNYAKSIGDISLIRCVESEIAKLGDIANDHQSHIPPVVSENSFEIIPSDIEINELITNLAISIEANTFYASVGFVFSSGLSLLSPIFQYITSQNGTIELIAGSLQEVNNPNKKTKIDKSTAIHINRLLSSIPLKLFTYEESFYHGKFYYLSSATKAYAIIGSTNISKTAFFDNTELDVLFSVDISAEERNPFIEWYDNFREHCLPISILNENEYHDFNWDSELNAYTEQFVKTLTRNEVIRKIEALEDSISKRRMQNWMRHNPSKCLSVHNIPALYNYVLFVFKDFDLAVFESFDLDNAYYVFACEDYQELISQISHMSKQQMTKASQYKSRGYHIQDQERLQENIDFYFR